MISRRFNLRLLVSVGDLDDPRLGFSLRLLASAPAFVAGDPSQPEHTSSYHFIAATSETYERHPVPPRIVECDILHDYEELLSTDERI